MIKIIISLILFLGVIIPTTKSESKAETQTKPLAKLELVEIKKISVSEVNRLKAKSEPIRVDSKIVEIQTDRQVYINNISKFLIEIKSPLGSDTNKYSTYIVDESIKNNIHPYAVVSVAFADSSLGKNLTTAYNLGNVGNTDSCPTCQAFSSWEQGISAIISTLNNKYLGKATKMCHLSRGGWNDCPEGSKVNAGKFYASSTSNWNKNASFAYSKLEGKEFKTTWSVKI